MLAIGYLVAVFLPYVNIAFNPFIYTSKHEGVKRILADMVVCLRRGNAAAAATVGTSSTASGNTGKKTAKKMNVSHK